MFKKIFLVIPLLVGFLLGYIGTSLFGKDLLMKGEVLSQEYEIAEKKSLTPTPSPAPTEIPTPSPELTKTPSPTPFSIPISTSIPQLTIGPEEIHGFIERFAAQYNVDPNVLRHIAVCESGFNPSGIKLNYAGLYQFSPNTWIKYRRLLGEDTNQDLRFSVEEATQTAAYVLSLGNTYIWPSCSP